MVQIEGEYKYVKGEGVEEFFGTFTSDAELIKKFSSSKPSIKVKNVAGDQWTISVTSAGKETTSNFKLGAPYDENMPQFGTLKSVTTREGDKFVTVTEAPTGDKFTRTYEFTPSGITVHLSNPKNALTCTRFYEKA